MCVSNVSVYYLCPGINNNLSPFKPCLVLNFEFSCSKFGFLLPLGKEDCICTARAIQKIVSNSEISPGDNCKIIARYKLSL
jgi:hypothetical protein